MCLAAGIGLAALDRGHAVPWDKCITLAIMGLGLVPILEFAARSLWAMLTAVGGAWLEWRERTAPVLPEVLDDPAPVPVQPNELERAWKVALSRFFRAGDAAGGFSARKLEGVVGSDTWPRLTAFYCGDDGNRILRVGPGDQGTVWNWGWDLDYTLQRIEAGNFPYPAGPVPDVQLFVANATQQRAPRRSQQRKEPPPRVIEHAP